MSLALDRFELRAYGPFTGTVLELQGAPGSLHLITGPNEIGKSTAQRAVGDFLFGIPLRSSDNQLHAYADMRLAATLVDADGARFELVRRKGTRSTLLDAEGVPVDEGVLERMLGGMTREAFAAMFSITHESLLVGGQELLAAGGEVGESLFSASLGASALHRVRESLDAEASELFRPRATSSLILQARARYEAAEAALRDNTLRAKDFLDAEQALADAVSSRDAVAEELRRARAEQNGRRRIRTLIPLVVERDGIRSELAGLADVPVLGADASERRVRASERLVADQAAARDAAARVEGLGSRIDALAGGDDLLEREVAVRGLVARVASVAESRSELDRLSSARETAWALGRRALVEMGSEVGLDEAADLVLDSRQRQRIDGALDQYAALRARLNQSEKAAREAAERVEDLRLQAKHRPHPADTAALELAFRAASADGPLESQLRDATGELAAAADALALAVAALQPAVAAAALTDQVVPSGATVERFRSEQDVLGERQTKLAERREQLEVQQRDLAVDRARLAVSGDVPTLEDLGFVRARRDRDWARVRARLEGDASAEVSPENVERGIAVADELSDTLREHAGLTAQIAELDLRGERLEAEFAAVSGAEEALVSDRSAFERAWAEAWEASGVIPSSAREMQSWLHDRTVAVERAATHARWARTVSELQARVDFHRVALTEALAWLGAADAAASGLVALLGLAEATVDAAAAQRAELSGVERESESAAVAVARERAAVRGAERELRAWRGQWRELVVSCGWPGDVAPEDARKMLETLSELAGSLRDADVAVAAIDGLAARVDRFEQDARSLVGETAPELADWPCAEAVGELARRLDEALRRRSALRELEGERDAACLEGERAQRSLAGAQAELAELLAAAGVSDVSELSAVESAAGRRDALTERLPQVEERIVQAGQASLEDILARTSAVDIDVMDAESQEGEAAVARLEGQLRLLDERCGELRTERAVMERAGGAADAVQAVEERVAELRELVERYLQVFVAAWALREAIDQYRRDHKDPLLRRASELFPALTRGSFGSLEADFDETDEPVLIGVRANGERVRVEQMSTGTREQLYLALRLASLERHVELHGPMPIVLDDVVLHSDPGRKMAILTALGELSRRTQVICFSHDPQLVALAQEALDPSLLTVHELGGRTIPGALHPLTVGDRDVRPLRRTEAA